MEIINIFKRKDADIAYTAQEIAEIRGRTRRTMSDQLSKLVSEKLLSKRQVSITSGGIPRNTYIYYLPENEGKIEEIIKEE